jgi:hypothetical protein
VSAGGPEDDQDGGEGAESAEVAEVAEVASEELSETERRRRRAQVFGEVLPDVTGDERGEGRDGDEAAGDDWLRRQVPPHHG